MVLIDGRGIPLSVTIAGASPAEVNLIEPLIEARVALMGRFNTGQRVALPARPPNQAFFFEQGPTPLWLRTL